MTNWKKGHRGDISVTAGLASMAILMVAGCSSGPNNHYPDSKATVDQALSQDNLSNVSVSQDRTRGTITLAGTLPSQEKKLQAEMATSQAAPKYTIADEIVVTPPPATAPVVSPADIAIQDRFNDGVKKHRYLADDTINAKATNGDLVLSGTVRTAYDKREAEKLAKAIPTVHNVENNLTVEPHKR